MLQRLITLIARHKTQVDREQTTAKENNKDRHLLISSYSIVKDCKFNVNGSLDLISLNMLSYILNYVFLSCLLKL